MTKTVRYSDLRAHLAEYLDQVARFNGEPIIIERRGKNPVALIDAAELSSLLETLHLFRSPANAKALFAALEDVQAGKGIEITMEEFLSKKWLPEHAEV